MEFSKELEPKNQIQKETLAATFAAVTFGGMGIFCGIQGELVMAFGMMIPVVPAAILIAESISIKDHVSKSTSPKP